MPRLYPMPSRTYRSVLRRAREATGEFALAASTLKESLVSLRNIVGGDVS